MFKTILLATALTVAAPALAQMAPPAGMMTAADVGVSPLSGTSATDYVKMAADSDMFEIATGRLAASKSKRADVKAFGKQMVSDHTATSKALMAALKNGDRTIAKPSTMMSAENQAQVTLLKKAPKANFDALYIQQQVASHQKAWALHSGYAAEGTDAPLKQVATTAVPVVERHIAHLKAMPAQ